MMETFFNSWNVIRASGLTAYLLLFFSLFFGFTHRLFKVKYTLLFHQIAGWFSFLFALLHGILLTIDPYVSYSFTEVFIPFTASYKPFLSGIGTISLFLLFFLLVSSDMMKWLGRKTWRIIHYLSTPAFFIAAIHGVFLGTDTQEIPIIILYSSTFTIIVLLFVFYRLMHQAVKSKKR